MNGRGNGNGPPSKLDKQLELARLRERVADLRFNEMTMRKDMLTNYLSRRRDIYRECDYPKDPTPWHFEEMYRTEAIAARVVEVLPRESWQVSPKVYEDDDLDVVTPFEEDWNTLDKALATDGEGYGESDLGDYLADEEGSAVWEHLLRADILSGIGSYGTLFLGFDDLAAGSGRSLTTPVEGVAPGTKRVQGRKLLFMRAFPEATSQITRWDSNPASPRYGRPEEYLITFNNPSEGNYTGIGITSGAIAVNWTRVQHVADNRLSSEVFGMSRQRQVFHRLCDLRKEYSSAGEGFWQACLSLLSFETHPALGGDVEIDKAGMKDMMEQIREGMKREMVLEGMAAKTVSPDVRDPTPFIKAAIEAICIKLGVPMRIFLGSERGELASSQDDAAWNDRLRQRQSGYITPRIIVPFVRRLIRAGVLRSPSKDNGFHVYWPDLTSQGALEKADVATKKTAAIVAYVSGGGESLYPPLDYLTRVLGETEDDARAILGEDTTEAGSGLLDDPSPATDGVESSPPEPPAAESGGGAVESPDAGATA